MENKKKDVEVTDDELEQLVGSYADDVMGFIVGQYADGVDRMSMAKALLVVAYVGLIERWSRDHPDMMGGADAAQIDADISAATDELVESSLDMLFGRILRW